MSDDICRKKNPSNPELLSILLTQCRMIVHHNFFFTKHQDAQSLLRAVDFFANAAFDMVENCPAID